MWAPGFAAPAKAPPVIAEHCRALAACDRIVIVHPNWWGQPPRSFGQLLLLLALDREVDVQGLAGVSGGSVAWISRW